MFLNRLVIVYLCLFFAMGPSTIMAAAAPGPFDYAIPGEGQGTNDVGMSDVGPTTGGAPSTYLGSASEYANDFSGEEGSRLSGTEAHLTTGHDIPLGDGAGVQRGSEYVSGYYKGAVLMPVRVWGAVQKPGLHKVPSGTDLMQLITLAGGPNADAELDHITIKRTVGGSNKVIRVAMNDLIDSPQAKIIELEPNDTIILPAAKPFINGNTLTVISVIATVVGIVASSFVIANQIKK